MQLKPIERPFYRKACPNWIDSIMLLPKGYTVLDFTTFSRDDEKSTMEHISRFTVQCSEASQNEYYKLQLFLLPLIGIAFT